MKRPNLKKKIRKTDFLTQKKFADSIGIDNRILSGIISGRINPTAEEFEKLAFGLNYDIYDVVNDWR